MLHTCKTVTIEECRVTEEERNDVAQRLKATNFYTALSYANKQISAQMGKEECRRYQDSFVLPMRRNLFGLLTIPVIVNHHTCTFIIDTGAQISGIKELKAKELGLLQSKASLSIGSVGGKQQQLKGLQAQNLRFGAIEYHNKAMIALDANDFSLRFANIDLLSFDGILGWDILSTLDFEMDDIAKTFQVFKNRFQLSYPNMIKGSFPLFLTKTKKGEIAVYGFDSGSKNSWIGLDAIHKFGYHITDEITALGMGVHGAEKMEMKIVGEIQLKLYKAQIKLKNTGTGRVALFDGFTFDGVLGNEIFKGRRLRIVNSKQMVLIA